MSLQTLLESAKSQYQVIQTASTYLWQNAGSQKTGLLGRTEKAKEK